MATLEQLQFLAKKLAAQKNKEKQDVVIGLDLLAMKIGGDLLLMYAALEQAQKDQLAKMVASMPKEELEDNNADAFEAAPEALEEKKQERNLSDAEILAFADSLARDVKELNETHTKELTELLASKDPVQRAQQQAVLGEPLRDLAKDHFAGITAAKKQYKPPVDTDAADLLLLDQYEETHTVQAANMLSIFAAPDVSYDRLAQLLFKQQMQVLERVTQSLPANLSVLDRNLVKAHALLQLLDGLKQAEANTSEPILPALENDREFAKVPVPGSAPRLKFGSALRKQDEEEYLHPVRAESLEPKSKPR